MYINIAEATQILSCVNQLLQAVEDSFETADQMLENILARIIYSHHFLTYYF